MDTLSRSRFSSVSLSDPFFDSLREDYPGFDEWFRKKSDESAYVLWDAKGGVDGFLYLKLETDSVDDVCPALPALRRVKIGTMKVNPHGTRLGERLIKKVFDHALDWHVDEVYVTVFPKHKKLIELFERYGFRKVGTKSGIRGVEDVFLRSLRTLSGDVTRDYPLLNLKGRKFLLSIYPKWHTRLLPDSKLVTESPDIIKDVSHANSIHKIYLCGMHGVEQLRRGDLLVIYRTSDGQGPAHYRSVVTSICTVEDVRDISSFSCVDELLKFCLPYSVFEDWEIRSFWRSRKYPTLIRFVYNVALKNRINRAKLLENKVITSDDYPGFTALSERGFKTVLELGGVNANFIIDKA